MSVSEFSESMNFQNNYLRTIITATENSANSGIPNCLVQTMNGRIYDPTLARFLSPDPILQNPGYTQSHNRYSYCLNNPLKYTDPSGYSYKPDDWNKFGGVVSMTFGFGAGLSGRLGPGSGNHWSDAYRNEAGNYMLMSSSTFNNMYGPGAADIASSLAGNAYTLNQWRQGTISISSVREAGGYFTQQAYTVTLASREVIQVGGETIVMSTNSGPGKISQHWVAVNTAEDGGGTLGKVDNFLSNSSTLRDYATIVLGMLDIATDARIPAETKPKYQPRGYNPAVDAKVANGMKVVNGVVGVMGKTLGVLSAVEHGNQAYQAFDSGFIWQGIGYTALTGLDIGLILTRSYPAVLAGSIVYGVLDATVF